MTNIQCTVIHETSGVPSYSGSDSFESRFSCMVNTDHGIGPQYFVEPNSTAFTLIGNQNFAGDPRLAG